MESDCVGPGAIVATTLRAGRAARMSTPVPRVVLDTNACLDLLLFGDPRAAALHVALRAGMVQAVSDAACRDEWLRVLDYPRLRLAADVRAGLVRAFDALMVAAPAAPSAPEARLPRCADPDDQKFVQLAHASGARWLVSRDRDVLALGRRTARAGWFEILTPQAWSMAGADLART